MILSPERQSELDQLGASLRADGWASFVTVERLLKDWAQLAAEADNYQLTIDDYTNDMTSRDGLEIALERSSEELREALLPELAVADTRYREATIEDGGAALERFFKHGHRGWWWERRPRSGPLADYLTRYD